jgi:hypothetical protein
MSTRIAPIYALLMISNLLELVAHILSSIESNIRILVVGRIILKNYFLKDAHTIRVFLYNYYVVTLNY